MFNSSNLHEHTKFSTDHISSEAELVKSLPNGLRHVAKSPPDSTVLWILAGFIIIRAVFVLIIPATRIKTNKKQVMTIGGRRRIPCKNCQYFLSNTYLKCAVHPTIVLTPKALNCSDYWPE